MIKIAKTRTIPVKDIKLIKGNRKVYESHKEKFKRRIQENGFGDTIKVVQRRNEYYAVEGQHRLRALFELGITNVPCSIVDWVNVDDFNDLQSFIISMNANNKKWDLVDYVKSFADKNIKEYVYLQKQINKYSKQISPGVVATIYDGVKRGHKQLKKGNLKFINKEASDFLISSLAEMVDRWGKSKLPAQALRHASFLILTSDDIKGYFEAFKLAATTQLTIGKEPIPDGDLTSINWFENTVQETYNALNNK